MDEPSNAWGIGGGPRGSSPVGEPQWDIRTLAS